MTGDSEPGTPRVALFGGSFDPVHLGHLGMAETAREAACLDRVVLVPCFVSPFKDGTVASAEQRLEMLRIAIGERGGDWLDVTDWELRREKPSYSWETAEHFHSSSPETEWCWILGTDQWEEIERWAQPEKLRRLLHFLVLTRDGTMVRDRPRWRYTAIPFSHPASSTRIRADFAANREWLTPGVSAYCRETGLYG